MTSHNTAADQAQHAKRAAERAATHPWMVYLGRFGYAAKGIVYAVLGILAVQAALGTGGQTTGTSGVLQNIASQPFGQILLGIVAVGLIGYVLWRFVQASMDTENKGNDAKGIAARSAYAVSGIIYGSVAVAAVGIIIGSNSSGDDGGQQDLIARVLGVPLGRWLVGLAGLLVIGFGLYQLYKAYSAKFREKLKLHEMSEAEETWATRLGRFGLASRGVVLGIVGGFIVQAAVEYQPSEAQGTGGALQFLQQGPFGWVILAVIAVGLIAYGIFMLFQARYRKMILG